MVRTIDVDMEIKATKFETALNKFFKKYPELDYWKETFEYLYESGEDHLVDNIDGMGNKIDWSYSLHFDVNCFGDKPYSFYFAIIERA